MVAYSIYVFSIIRKNTRAICMNTSSTLTLKFYNSLECSLKIFFCIISNIRPIIRTIITTIRLYWSVCIIVFFKFFFSHFLSSPCFTYHIYPTLLPNVPFHALHNSHNPARAVHNLPNQLYYEDIH